MNRIHEEFALFRQARPFFVGDLCSHCHMACALGTRATIFLPLPYFLLMRPPGLPPP